MIILGLDEKWIPGYEGHYSLKTNGDVITYRGHFKKPRPLSVRLNSDGYPETCLQTLDGKSKYCRIHRLLAMTYMDFSPKLQVDHKNGIKTDNRLENLELVTCQENIQRSHRLGLRDHKGEKHPKSKLSNSDVKEIRDLYSTGLFTYEKLGDLYSMSLSGIGLIINRETWGHI